MTQLQANYNKQDVGKLDIWGLIQNGYFKEACEKADLEYEETKNVFPLRNKLYALFHLERYEECILLSEQIIKLRNGETASDFIFNGIAHWLLNKRKEAIETWMNAEKCKYKDAAGGIETEAVLYYASLINRDRALKITTTKKINRLLKSKRSVYWPAPLGYYILGGFSDEMLLSKISSQTGLKERQLCQADFVISIRQLEEDNIDDYRKKLQDCVSHGPYSFLEQVYYLAKGELRKLT